MIVFSIGANSETRFTSELLRTIRYEVKKEGIKSIKDLEFEFCPHGEKGHFIKVLIPKKIKFFSQILGVDYETEYNTVDIPVSFKNEGSHILVGYKNELRQKKRR